ncbi:MAG: glycoside hydrolase family 1 protein [Candidatus Sericytochromatia bacterium]|nr:glycoside hydrolase family 1 protein [Candidatus Tanganyikabacteria bacterium]
MAGLEFPDGFLWGAATAAHQVEGGIDNDWTHFERQPRAIKNGDRSELGVDHYRRFDADFGLAADMGHNAHRLSIEWARIEPARGHYDRSEIDHYHEVIASLRKRGLEPFVTLHHFTNPRWVADQGGWLEDRTVDDFVRYAAFMGKEFRGAVRFWITINEPNIYACHSYVTGTWPPRRHSFPAAMRVLSQLSRAHLGAYRALREADPAARIGYSQNLMTFAPFACWSPVDRAFVRLSDRLFNRSVLDVVHGALDFIGVNYYTRAHLRFPRVILALAGAPRNDLGWEIYPDGLYEALKLAGEYARPRGIPVYVTENGIDDRLGERRSAYLVDHLRAVHRAVSEGVDVRGYIHWTLMDNFEWAEGYAPRFGLFYVDRENDLARVPTPAVGVFRTVTTHNGLTPDLLDRFAPA